MEYLKVFKNIGNGDEMNYLAYDIETTGLDPLPHLQELLKPNGKKGEEWVESRICSIGVKNDKLCKIFFNKDEKKLLQEFWDFIRLLKIEEDLCLVGYNSVKFDFWFLTIRSLKHGIKIVPMKKKYEHLDVMFALTPYGNSRKLSQFSKLLDLEEELHDSFKSADIPKLWEQEAYQEIIEHNMTDIKKTWELFKKAYELKIIQDITLSFS